jgi:hypothetical protein
VKADGVEAREYYYVAPVQTMNVYKGKPRLWEEINREFLAPVTVPLGIHRVFRLGPRDSLEVLNKREIF